MAAVEAAGGEQFLGAGHAQFLAEFRPQHVLPAVAARQREVGGAVISPARQIGDQQGVFIVGMGGDVKHAAHFAEALQLLQNGGRGRRFGGFTCGCARQQADAGDGKAREPVRVPVRPFERYCHACLSRQSCRKTHLHSVTL